MIKRNNTQPIASSIDIELLPGFGWDIGNSRVFGPGQIFQGYVVLKCNEHSAKATTFRLVFQATEAMLSHDLGPGIQRAHTSNLFGVATNLWIKEEDNELIPMTTYRFLFTIQMPMVQFPPSIDHQYYRCSYKLTAYLDPSLAYKEVPVMCQRLIRFIPLIETRLLKTPLVLKNVKKRLMEKQPKIAASVKLNAIEYVAGDTIQATVCVTDSPKTLNDLSISMNVYQISKFNLDQKPILNQLVATTTFILKNNNSHPIHDAGYRTQTHQVRLELDENLPPSMEYSEIMSLSYKLVISIHKTIVTKKNNKRLLSLKNLLVPWTNDLCLFEQLILIGTMGGGIRTGDDLNVYSKYNKTNKPMPHPKFLKTIEYEDALPLYDPSRLPSYQN
ncbi:unnamed protein product [Rhizopus stolonifer]